MAKIININDFREEKIELEIQETINLLCFVKKSHNLAPEISEEKASVAYNKLNKVINKLRNNVLGENIFTVK